LIEIHGVSNPDETGLHSTGHGQHIDKYGENDAARTRLDSHYPRLGHITQFSTVSLLMLSK
jgi:hypothetical protein